MISNIISDGKFFRPYSLAYVTFVIPVIRLGVWWLFPDVLSHIREDRPIYRNFVGKPDRNTRRLFGSIRSRWLDNTKLYFEYRAQGQYWIRKANNSRCDTPS